MTSLKISKTLSLPATAITETFAVLAERGAGKSNTAADMAEEMFKAKLPFVVVDPVRAWWGLLCPRRDVGRQHGAAGDGRRFPGGGADTPRLACASNFSAGVSPPFFILSSDGKRKEFAV